MNTSICSFDETGTIKIENQQEMARYEAFEEKSRRVSPEPNQVMSPVHDDHFEKMEEHQSFIPNTRDSLNNIKFENVTSPVRDSYSAKRIRRNAYASAQKHQNSSRNSLDPLQKGYSNSKKSTAHLYLSNSSRPSPTFRPKMPSKPSSKHHQIAPKPPRKRVGKKRDSNIVGMDQNGNAILNKFSLKTVPVPHKNSQNYQRKRISLEEEQKTKQWLRRINFHGYVTEEKPDLLEDAMRNGILF